MPHASCLCGAIEIDVAGDLPSPNACHCTQCRKQSGHYWASVDLPASAVTITGPVTWYAASEKVRRGFCGTCGSFLIWDPLHHDSIAIAMGAFDGPTGTMLSRHIFCADKGDYYEITDALPQNEQ